MFSLALGDLNLQEPFLADEASVQYFSETGKGKYLTRPHSGQKVRSGHPLALEAQAKGICKNITLLASFMKY
ncbi:MAG: hypothetical protein A2010_17990 [Nitrospirae bacterium GWD2_57_9]|nr:MAG: hypothetical protein A2010_17990 [Nitrospirae bacterium GWD2_57_9]